MSEVLICKMYDCRSVDDGLLDEVLSLLSNERRGVAETYMSFNDRVMSAVAGLCMEELGRRLHTSVIKLPNGKPVFSTGDMHLSVSHSAGMVVIAWSDMPVGVDVQGIVPMGRIADRMLTPSEKVVMPDMTDRSLVRVWTMKESYLKMIGVGVAKGLSGLDVLSNGTSIPGDGFGFRTEYVSDDVILTVCGRSDIPIDIEISVVRSLDDILNTI